MSLHPVTWLRSVQAVVIALCTLLFASHAQGNIALSKLHAIWVYPDPAKPGNNPVLSAAAGQQLIDSLRASKVNMIYLSVYSSTPNSKGRYIYDETLLANFIAAARFASVQVYAAYGAPDWPTLGCGTTGSPSFPIQRLQEIGTYNATNPSALVFDPITHGSYTSTGMFNGVILDIEPLAADQNLLDLYACAHQTAQQSSLGLSVAINAFWNNMIGSGGPAYQQILDMGFNNVVIMGYRNFAGTFGASDNSIIAIDTPAVVYKNDFTTVLIGLETKNLGAGDPQNTQSFYASNQAALDYQAQSVYNQFRVNQYNFGGFAIHNYADSYLGGTSNWPLTNPIFPMDASTQFVNAGIPTAIDIGTATVSVLLPNVSNSSATVTVTPLNPATQTPTPTGFQLTGLAFDVSTTAIFTGASTVCFSLPSVDATTFANLRVLHYLGGVAMDQTILSGANAPNITNKTICASVTSFSPFVIAQAKFVAMLLFRVASLTADKSNFRLEGDFTLPAAAQVAIGSDISLALGTAILKIPAGQLKRDGRDDDFDFEGVVNDGVRLHLELQKDRNQSYKFDVRGQYLDLTKQVEPIHVQVQIGKYLGSATVFAITNPQR